MKTREETERLANDTLNSIDGIQQVEANSFLFGKIQNRMQIKKQREQGSPVRVLSGLSAALALFIGLNLASYYYLPIPAQKQPSSTTVQQKTTIAQNIAAEYNLTSGSYNY